MEPPPPASPAATISVSCPACGVELRNVMVAPGAALRCLNCNKRFVPLAAATEEKHPTGLSASPPSAGYWLLRIPAFIACAAALVFAPIIATAIISDFWYRPVRYDDFMGLLYLALMPWAGLLLVFLTRALARADAAGVHAAWRAGILREPLPAVPGSSLPYLAPLAVAGGVLPAVAIRSAPGESEAALVSGIIGAVLFYLGFALEDLRQFAWRQECLARACIRKRDGTEDRAGPHTERGRCGLLLGATAALLALTILMFLTESYSPFSYRRNLLPLFCSVALLGLAYSLHKLGRDWDEAVAWWEQAATMDQIEAYKPRSYRFFARRRERFIFVTILSVLLFFAVLAVQLPPGREYDLGEVVALLRAVALSAAIFFVGYLLVGWIRQLKSGSYLSPLALAMRYICRLPLVWVFYGVVWFILMLLKNEFGRETAALFLLFSAFGAFAAWLAFFLAQICRWRSAQRRFWESHPPSEAGETPAVQTPAWRRWLVWGGVALAAVQFLIFLIWTIDQSGWLFRNFPESFAWPLVIAAAHYPTVWLALLLREFLALEDEHAADRH